MHEPLISFVTTVYNKAPFLEKTLAALRAQQDIAEPEYIFVDDGSTDGSLALLQTITKDWPNCRVITQENQGAAAATNAGIAAARGSYVKLLDGDDVLHPEVTKRLHAALEKHPDAIAAYAAGETVANERLGRFKAPISDTQTFHKEPLPMVLRRNAFNPSQVLVKRSALRACGGCDADPRIRFGQDYTLNLRLARLGAFVSLDAALVHFPAAVPGRVSGDQAEELRRLNIAVMLFLQQHPDTPARLKRLAAVRCAGRSYAYARRHFGARPLVSPAFWRYARSFLPLRDTAAFIAATLNDFIVPSTSL